MPTCAMLRRDADITAERRLPGRYSGHPVCGAFGMIRSAFL